jgi:hypothetical protein
MFLQVSSKTPHLCNPMSKFHSSSSQRFPRIFILLNAISLLQSRKVHVLAPWLTEFYLALLRFKYRKYYSKVFLYRHNGLEGFRWVRLPGFSVNRHKVARLSKYRPPLRSREDPWYSFVRRWIEPRSIMWREGLSQWKNLKDLIGNRIRNLPARSAYTCYRCVNLLSTKRHTSIDLPKFCVL